MKYICHLLTAVWQGGAQWSAVGVAAVDTLVWQAFASVIVPGERLLKRTLQSEIPKVSSPIHSQS
jgi:hypothetical protein